jgi:hypothetical protein
VTIVDGILFAEGLGTAQFTAIMNVAAGLVQEYHYAEERWSVRLDCRNDVLAAIAIIKLFE